MQTVFKQYRKVYRWKNKYAWGYANSIKTIPVSLSVEQEMRLSLCKQYLSSTEKSTSATRNAPEVMQTVFKHYSKVYQWNKKFAWGYASLENRVPGD